MVSSRSSRELAEFTDFVRARGPALARTAYVLTGDAHLAEDLLQAALAKALPRWHRLDEPEAYVRRCMVTENISWWRRRRLRETPSDVLPERARGDEHPAEVTTRLALAQALDLLTHKQRTVLVLRFYDDLSEAQTAELLGVSVGTVKSQTFAALKRLRIVAPELSDPAFQTAEERA